MFWGSGDFSSILSLRKKLPLSYGQSNWVKLVLYLPSFVFTKLFYSCIVFFVIARNLERAERVERRRSNLIITKIKKDLEFSIKLSRSLEY